ncbi:MAG: hypothetical protein KKF44_08930 [Nanoarchaeota archaeon]|nr:hypothetical protein [Nanoarchaeota archaeon]
MSYVIVKHKVEDFGAWKSFFDKSDKLRKSNGEISHRIFTDENDEKQVFGLFEFKSADKAKKFFSSADLKQKMKEAGVVDLQGTYFLEAQ